ncbi:MAG: TlyA family RNA methyltransferase [Chloroflexi bacterium]|nr:TlyA family RNA methyltransferase [Chloroflexota bacterium]
MSRRSALTTSRRVRVDDLLVRQGAAPDLQSARALIMSGRVHGDGKRYSQAGMQVDDDTELSIRTVRPYASRGGEKLSTALDAWPIPTQGRVCLDVGASTGGFTDVLLRRGALHVHAVDVGYGQLADALRRDSRVTVLERTHICDLPSQSRPADLATVDVSFIGLRQVLPCVARAVAPQSDVVALVKPQFEAPPEDVDQRGVVNDALAQGRSVSSVVAWAVEQGWRTGGVLKSPLVGPAGNHEWFVWLRTP